MIEIQSGPFTVGERQAKPQPGSNRVASSHASLLGLTHGECKGESSYSSSHRTFCFLHSTHIKTNMHYEENIAVAEEL